MTAAKLQRICPYSSNQLNPLWTWESAVMTKNNKETNLSLFIYMYIYSDAKEHFLLGLNIQALKIYGFLLTTKINLRVNTE